MKNKTILALISLSLAINIIMGCGKDGGSNQTTAGVGDIQTGASDQGSSNPIGINNGDPNQTGTGDVITGETGTSGGTDQPPVAGDGTGQTVVTNVVLAWDMPTTYVDGTPLTNLAGFKVYYGTASGVYPQVIDVRDMTTYSSGTLGPGTYYFAVTSYDSYGSESEFSNEISTTIL
jgi:hypothetical protein